MKKVLSVTESGFSLVELMLGVALFGMIVTTFGSAILSGQEGQRLAGERSRAVSLAEEGLEAVRSIRNRNWDDVVVGTHGITISGNQFQFSGSSDVVDIFTRSIEVTELDGDRRQVDSKVSWDQNAQRAGEVVLTTQLTNWRNNAGGGPALTCELYCQSLLIYSGGSCRNSPARCAMRGEVHESQGDSLCVIGQSDTCCCAP